MSNEINVERYQQQAKDFATDVSVGMAAAHQRYPDLSLETVMHALGWVIGATTGTMREDLNTRIGLLQIFMRGYQSGYTSADDGTVTLAPLQ